MAQVKLKDISCRAPEDLDKKEIKEETAKILEELNDLQNLLFAENRHSILVVLQGMDASGKDGVIRNVFTSMNPQGVSVKGFKAPTAEELSHDFLWRIHLHTPPKGMVQIFNRSHYEDILVTRVHKWCDDETAFQRMDAINNFDVYVMLLISFLILPIILIGKKVGWIKGLVLLIVYVFYIYYSFAHDNIGVV